MEPGSYFEDLSHLHPLAPDSLSLIGLEPWSYSGNPLLDLDHRGQQFLSLSDSEPERYFESPSLDHDPRGLESLSSSHSELGLYFESPWLDLCPLGLESLSLSDSELENLSLVLQPSAQLPSCLAPDALS